jgi:hypothetical protein
VLNHALAHLEDLPYACVPDTIVESLRQLPRNQTLAKLKEIITLAQDPDLSDRAMDAILQIDPEFSKSVLLEVRVRPDWEWFFCYASIAYGDDSFVAPLCEILLNSQNPKARYMAAVALQRHGNRNAIHALTVALHDLGTDHEGREISAEAAAALAAIAARG